ncbi:DDE-type integrase/transposase/recombinase [Sneathiella sp.]
MARHIDLWCAVDNEKEVLEVLVSKRCDRKAVTVFLKRRMRYHA